jgi:hypothetical protein
MSDLESFRSEAKGWIEQNLPPSLKGSGARSLSDEGDSSIWGGRRVKWKNPDSKLWLERMGTKRSTSLIYTSPSPRDRSVSRMASCG